MMVKNVTVVRTAQTYAKTQKGKSVALSEFHHHLDRAIDGATSLRLGA
jgi:hypothetical protein